MNCKNCGKEVTGTYCSHCGQKAAVERITFGRLLRQVTESMFQVESGFWYTFKGLSLTPGKTIKEYLEGKRKLHYRPIPYVLVLSTFYFLLTKVMGQATWMDDLITGFTNGMIQVQINNHHADVPSILRWFANSFAYGTLLLMPLFAFASYICRINKNYNFPEHLVISLYVSGQQAVIYALFSVANRIYTCDLFETLPLFFSIFYASVVFWKFFDKESRVMNVILTLFTYIIYFVLSIACLFAVLGVKELM